MSDERTARLEVRVSPAEKALLRRAAELGGEDASSLTRRAALVEARRVIARAGEAEGKEGSAGSARRRGSGGRR